MGYIEKYGTGITENIRRMQEAHLLAPEIDLSAEFITTIWRDNIATDHLAENKRFVDKIVKKKIRPRMTKEQLRECIIDACVVDHSIDELAALMFKCLKLRLLKRCHRNHHLRHDN